jgi:ABC-type sugar transport system ATPase subunit
MAPRLELRDISKVFPGVKALERVSLDVMPGEVHALLGENGAGKSTLGKIIAGVYARDEGSVTLDGVSLGDIDEVEAGRLGVGIVHQEGSLVRTLSIADNIFAGRQPTRSLGRVDVEAMVARSRALLEQLGVDIDPKAKVATLSSAQAQVVEIAKALSQDLRLLILDEPTAALTLTESERLFEAVRRLKANGVSIVYVSHRLAEIFTVCDRVSVLKDGRLSGTREVAATSTDELIRLMVGRDIVFSRQPGVRASGPPILEVERLSAEPFVHDVSFAVRAGEIVCLAGLVGSGRSEACEAIFGARPRSGGEVRLRGTPVRFRDPSQAIAAGVGMAPEDRKEAGLFLTMDVASNISVSVMDRVSEAGRISSAKSEALARRFVEELHIVTPSVRAPVGNLSGGNQQKVMLAKWLALEPLALIVDEPTRGVDVGARAEIYRILRGLAARGVALLVVSSDLPEVLTLADRIVVMADGRSVGELAGSTADEEAVLRLATLRAEVSAALDRSGRAA